MRPRSPQCRRGWRRHCRVCRRRYAGAGAYMKRDGCATHDSPGVMAYHRPIVIDAREPKANAFTEGGPIETIQKPRRGGVMSPTATAVGAVGPEGLRIFSHWIPAFPGITTGRQTEYGFSN